MSKVKIGIIGAAGYTGGELIRILIDHPEVEIVYAHSNSSHGKPISDVHADLIGETDLTFINDLHYNLDCVFLCMGHGASKKFLDENTVPDSVKIIDLSHDFRLNGDHNFIYGLPELNKEGILKKEKNIANPGCFATTIQLGLLPAAKCNMIKGEINTSAITGSTGAGQNPSATTHFSWRNNNMSVYKAFEHQHLGEIGESLTQISGGTSYDINFIPYRGDFTRGIIATQYFDFDGTEDEAYAIYEDFYANHPFVHVTRSNPYLKQVVNTNKCLVHLEKHKNKLMVISMTDNLIKGASGQAVQNMNLIFGLDEMTGLHLKPSGF